MINAGGSSCFLFVRAALFFFSSIYLHKKITLLLYISKIKEEKHTFVIFKHKR